MANPEHLALLKQGIKVWNRLRQANLNINIDNLDLSMTDLGGADLFVVADLLQAIFGRADLWMPSLWEGDLREVDLLEGGDLRKVDLREADLHETDLRGANLRMGDLRGVNLFMADLRGADLHETDLRGADLRMANLSGTGLIKAHLGGANLGGADLRDANLGDVNLSGANLIKAHLGGANLGGADLGEAQLGETVFANINLTDTKGLDTCRHEGPSILDFRTLQRSGPLPLAFLRGCGLPDLLIDYLPPLLNQPIQFYSCFISYSSKDEEFVMRLHADLQSLGLRCWFAPADIQAGRKIYEQIGDAIRLHDKLLLVLSEHSMNSEWVKVEIAKARQREVLEKRQVLFPIRLVDYETIQQWDCFDAETGKDLTREIREYFIPDFSQWCDPNLYQVALSRLVRDLTLDAVANMRDR